MRAHLDVAAARRACSRARTPGRVRSMLLDAAGPLEAGGDVWVLARNMVVVHPLAYERRDMAELRARSLGGNVSVLRLSVHR